MTASLSACPVLVLPTKRDPRARPFEEERTDPRVSSCLVLPLSEDENKWMQIHTIDNKSF